MPGGNHLREAARMNRAIFLCVILMAGFMPVAKAQNVGFVQVTGLDFQGRPVRDAGRGLVREEK